MRMITGYGAGKPEIWHALELKEEERRQRHGQGSYEAPQGLVAGEFTSVPLEFILGSRGVAEGGRLAIYWRWPFDWSALQCEDPAAPGYYTVRLSRADGSAADVELSVVYHAYKGIEPYHHNLELTVKSGRLDEGDRVQVVCGDTSSGSPGWQAPTCATSQSRFLMLVDSTGGPRWTELPGSETFSILPGSAERLVLMAPSDAVIGEPCRLILRAEDQWGNAAGFPDNPTITSAEGAPIEVQSPIQLQEPPACHVDVKFNSIGVVRLRAEVPGTSLTDESNPIRVHQQPPADRLFWGDVHAGQSLIGCGAGTLAENYAYGRDAAGLQFITHQANDHYVTAADWEETRRVTDDFYEPGRYAAILGCEWSPYVPQGGDRNVFYFYDEPRMRRSARFFVEDQPDPEPDVPTAPEFHEKFRDLDVLVNIHVGGRPTNLKWYDPKIERLAEIHSTHATSEWFIEDCLERGYKVGITAGTDGVMGRPGACSPGSRLIRNVRNGLTAVMAKELTREGLREALHARRCYGTTGQRILLEVNVDGQPMGAELETSGQPTIRVTVEGTAAIERVDLLRGTEVIHHWDLAPPATADGSQVRILWGGAARRGTARTQQLHWNGHLVFEGATIESVQPVGFQCPLDQWLLQSPDRVGFQAATAGNDMGLILTLQGDLAASGRFESEPCSFDFKLSQIQQQPLRVDAGDLNRRVELGLAPAAGAPRHVMLDFRDTEAPSGLCPYWVRVVQVDRARAWSSPVYVTRS